MSRDEAVAAARLRLREIYRATGYGSFYAAVREALCPFFHIESHIPTTGTIIDIGCGYGLMAHVLAMLGPQRTVIGVDKSEYRIGKAQATLRETPGAKLTFMCEDIRTAPLRDCDGVTMVDVLHHMPTTLQEEVLRRLPEIVRPGGVVVIKEFADRPRWKYWATLLFEAVFYPNDKLTYRPIPEWQALLEQLGFRVTLHEEHAGSFVPSVMLIAVRR